MQPALGGESRVVQVHLYLETPYYTKKSPVCQGVLGT